jgi:transcription elongation factor GreA
MQLPYRKPGIYSQVQTDPLLTEEKFLKMKDDLTRLKKNRPAAAAEVARTAQNGDFSENAEYQHAKGRLRGINAAIEKLEFELGRAVIIEARSTQSVSVGHRVTVDYGGALRTYHILGSAETDPARGIISHTSPIGAALLGCSVGDEVLVKLAAKEMVYKIMRIE